METIIPAMATLAEDFLRRVRASFGPCTVVYETRTDDEVIMDYLENGEGAWEMYQAWDRRFAEEIEIERMRRAEMALEMKEYVDWVKAGNNPSDF